jgi:hypothetical protein
MIKNILELLSLDPHYGQSEIIEIAKGKYKIQRTWKQAYKQFKRELKWLMLK